MSVLAGMEATEMIRKYEAESRADGDPVIILGLTGNVVRLLSCLPCLSCLSLVTGA
jgi:hypothetical protein